MSFHIIHDNLHLCSTKPWHSQKFLFQQVIPNILESVPLSNASAVYHAACLVDAFFDLRPQWKRLRKIEENVLRQLSHIPTTTPIILNSLRCYGFPHPQGRLAFPVLWGENSRFYRVCGEHNANVHIRKSIYIPYLDTWYRYNQLANTRDRKVIFAGYLINKERKEVAKAVENTPGGDVLLFKNRSHNTVDLSKYEYVTCPKGDTPESQRIMQAIVHGSIPLINNQMYKFPFFKWDKISYPLIIVNNKISFPPLLTQIRIQKNIIEANKSFFDKNRWIEYVFQQWKTIRK